MVYINAMNILPVLLLTATATTLVLRSGDRIDIDDTVREEKGVVTFRVKGTLYSMPASEIARIIREPEETPAVVVVRATDEPQVKLAVSEEDRKRLLAELEKNHAGTAPAQLPAIELPPAPPQNTQDEWAWRRQARDYEEAIRRAYEELELLETRAREAEMKIRTLIMLGYKPRSFTYDSTVLAATLEQIPRARLEIMRAERAYADFRDEARRRGVMPGWLR